MQMLFWFRRKLNIRLRCKTSSNQTFPQTSYLMFKLQNNSLAGISVYYLRRAVTTRVTEQKRIMIIQGIPPLVAIFHHVWRVILSQAE